MIGRGGGFIGRGCGIHPQGGEFIGRDSGFVGRGGGFIGRGVMSSPLAMNPLPLPIEFIASADSTNAPHESTTPADQSAPHADEFAAPSPFLPMNPSLLPMINRRPCQ